MSESKHIRLLNKYDAEIAEEKYNPLIGRREIVLRIYHAKESTPSRGLIKAELSKIYNKSSDLVYVRRIKSEYGSPTTRVEVYIYDNIERAKKFEPKHIIKRDEESSSKLQLQG